MTFIDKYLNFIKEFLPESKGVSSVGLDVSKNSCKMIELVYSGDSFEITNYCIESSTDGKIEDVLRKMGERLQGSVLAPVTAISGKGTLIRYVDMPRMSEDDLEKSFSLEADKYFPFPKDDIYTDCSVVDPGQEKEKMSVLVAAAKKDIVDQRVELLRNVGAQIETLSLNPIAIANIFQSKKEFSIQEASDSSSDTLAVLDMGDVVSNLMIFKDNVPRFTRDVFVGSQDFTKCIANAMKISLQEAESLKVNLTGKDKETMDACESVLLNLVSEIRLSFDYFINEKNLSIGKLLLTGGGCLLVGLEKAFADHLDIEVEKWNPFHDIKLADNVSKEEIEKNAQRLTVALGLALSK